MVPGNIWCHNEKKKRRKEYNQTNEVTAGWIHLLCMLFATLHKCYIKIYSTILTFIISLEFITAFLPIVNYLSVDDALSSLCYSPLSSLCYSLELAISTWAQVKNLLAVDPEDAVPLKKMIIRKIPRYVYSLFSLFILFNERLYDGVWFSMGYGMGVGTWNATTSRCQLIELTYLCSYISFACIKELTLFFSCFLFILQGFWRLASIWHPKWISEGSQPHCCCIQRFEC